MSKKRESSQSHSSALIAERELIQKLGTYLKDTQKIKEALNLSKTSHKNFRRNSGDPYIIHPIAVSQHLAQINSDEETIVAALLHDVLEDTDTKPETIKKLFGPTVLNLIESLTKLSQVRIKKSWFPFATAKPEKLEEFDQQIENLRKMLVSVAQDVRVILIKFADRIHNLETLKFLPAIRRERIAREALEIYAPIAERLGMSEWRGQMEDLSFEYLHPSEFLSLKEQFLPILSERKKYLGSILRRVTACLNENDIKYTTDFRVKKWYSLHRKLQKYDRDPSKIYDLIAVRIIVESVGDCYKALGCVHSIYKPLVGRIKDYIAFPKPNGYRSIHTTVICEKGVVAEFQIRTREMHYQAEFGVAAHWLYSKEKKSLAIPKTMLGWLTDFNKLQKGTSSSELADAFKMDLFQNRIFVFTPDGDVKNLPQEATPVDFAYAVHTWLGNHCGQARVNGKIAALDTHLRNGDIVEIVPNKKSKPHSDWIVFVKTHLARNQIRRELKASESWDRMNPIYHVKKKFKKRLSSRGRFAEGSRA